MTTALRIRQRQNPPGEFSVHPPIDAITDALSFKVARFAAINERSGSHYFRTVHNITLNQWRVLGLTAALGPVSSSEIREILYMDKGQFSRTVKSLVDDGYIHANTDSNDARAVALELSTKGQTLHDKLLCFTAERNESVVSVLSQEECHTLLNLLDKLRVHNEALQKKAGVLK